MFFTNLAGIPEELNLHGFQCLQPLITLLHTSHFSFRILGKKGYFNATPTHRDAKGSTHHIGLDENIFVTGIIWQEHN